MRSAQLAAALLLAMLVGPAAAAAPGAGRTGGPAPDTGSFTGPGGRAAAPGPRRTGGPGVAANDTGAPVTDNQVSDAIEKARAYVLKQQQANGFWPDTMHANATSSYGQSEMAVYTLICTSDKKNPLEDPAIAAGLDAITKRPLDYTYAISMRCMALARAFQCMGASPRRDAIRMAMEVDAKWICVAQNTAGAWGYKQSGGPPTQTCDLSNTHMAIAALDEAAAAGLEIPAIVWQKALNLCMSEQHTDGSWNYGTKISGNKEIGGMAPGYGSMTAGGLASLLICMDRLDPAGGCPCRGAGASPANKIRTEVGRHLDMGFGWVEKNFDATKNPRLMGGHMYAGPHYWLYAAERACLAAGYRNLGDHDWYREGASVLVKTQRPTGEWAVQQPPGVSEVRLALDNAATLPDTCFAMLFLHKGRLPILFNKLRATPGAEWIWDSHSRDIANLTAYCAKGMGSACSWRVVSLRDPVDTIREAPILYISAQSAPKFTAEEERKLREFTDAGGTILFEASCGNPAVRVWFKTFAAKVWPDWPLKALAPEHPTFANPNSLTQRPEIWGIDDGKRTLLFYAMDDISCPWQTKAAKGKEYLFKWAVNLVTYAKEHSPTPAVQPQK